MARILVVDNELHVANLVYEVLKKVGYDVGVVYSAEAALKEIKEKEFDLVITDLDMPEMNGFQLLEAIQGLGKTMPVIAMTGNILDWDTKRLTKFRAILTKPFFNIKDRVSTVKGILGY